MTIFDKTAEPDNSVLKTPVNMGPVKSSSWENQRTILIFAGAIIVSISLVAFLFVFFGNITSPANTPQPEGSPYLVTETEAQLPLESLESDPIKNLALDLETDPVFEEQTKKINSLETQVADQAMLIEALRVQYVALADVIVQLQQQQAISAAKAAANKRPVTRRRTVATSAAKSAPPISKSTPPAVEDIKSGSVNTVHSVFSQTARPSNYRINTVYRGQAWLQDTEQRTYIVQPGDNLNGMRILKVETKSRQVQTSLGPIR